MDLDFCHSGPGVLPHVFMGNSIGTNCAVGPYSRNRERVRCRIGDCIFRRKEWTPSTDRIIDRHRRHNFIGTESVDLLKNANAIIPTFCRQPKFSKKVKHLFIYVVAYTLLPTIEHTLRPRGDTRSWANSSFSTNNLIRLNKIIMQCKQLNNIKI